MTYIENPNARQGSVIGRSRRKPLAFMTVILGSLWFTTAHAQSGMAPLGAEGVLGRWVTDNGNLEVEIAHCGEALCGTVTKVIANRSMSGNGEMKAVDNRNPLGMTILDKFVPAGRGEWSGEIYNRENAKTYSCKISLGDKDQLIVRPYIGLPLFGRTLVWTRSAAAQIGQK